MLPRACHQTTPPRGVGLNCRGLLRTAGAMAAVAKEARTVPKAQIADMTTRHPDVVRVACDGVAGATAALQAGNASMAQVDPCLHRRGNDVGDRPFPRLPDGLPGAQIHQ